MSTRALTHEVSDSGVQTFTMDPSSLTANSGTMPIWSGIDEVFQTETFNVPRTDPSSGSRLLFSADYQFTGQGSLLHVALFEPDGTYAAYTVPQGLADFAEDGSDRPGTPGAGRPCSLQSSMAPPGRARWALAALSSGTPKRGSTRRQGRLRRQS